MKVFKRIKWKKSEVPFSETMYGYIEYALFFSCSPIEITIQNKQIDKWVLRIYLPGYKEAITKTKKEAIKLANQILTMFISKFTCRSIIYDSTILDEKLMCSKCNKKVNENFSVLKYQVFCLKCVKNTMENTSK